jgi:AcrR family transcriptional regulator
MALGRRPGKTRTREALVRAARRRFAERGYDKTTVRAVAADAGVDPGLVTHFFGTKDALFRAAMDWPFDPDDLVRTVVEPGRRGMGARLARTFLELWQAPESQARLLAVFRGATTHEESATLVREFVHGQLYTRLAAALDGEDAELRVDLAFGQLLGLAMLRHVLRVEPVASASIEELVTRIAPTLDRYFRTPHP